MEEKVAARPRHWRRLALVILALLALTAATLLAAALLYVRAVLNHSRLTYQEVRQKVTLAKQKQARLPDRINFLILGLDRRDDELEHTLLTDTIIFASLNTENAQVTLLSIPRDLWLDHLKTKINAVYYYGEIDKNTTGPELLVAELTTILNQPINFWLVLDYQNLTQLVDRLGGVDVYLENGFTDHEYPNPAYVEATDSGEPQYLTIAFAAGLNRLDGERALEFVRSRSSPDLKQGNDLARSARQLQLVKGMLAKIKDRRVMLNPEKLGNLYRFWREKISTNFTDADILAILMEIFPRRSIALNQSSIPATYETEGAILVHPRIAKYGQWVWETQTGDWSELQEFVKTNL